jgi:hypothetical protein
MRSPAPTLVRVPVHRRPAPSRPQWSTGCLSACPRGSQINVASNGVVGAQCGFEFVSTACRRPRAANVSRFSMLVTSGTPERYEIGHTRYFNGRTSRAHRFRPRRRSGCRGVSGGTVTGALRLVVSCALVRATRTRWIRSERNSTATIALQPPRRSRPMRGPRSSRPSR